MRPWHEKTLGEFVSLQRGHDLPTNNRGTGRVPVVGSFGITGYHDIARAKGPGVTVGRSGASAGAVYFVNEDYWPHNTCLFVTDFQGNNPRFAYYLLSRLDLPNHAVGSAQPSLNRNHISPLPIRVPDRPEQDRIAHVLSTLDDKIELNRRMNETLEQMAQAIFKDWFVDFGPVRRKQEGASDPIAIMGGLVQDTPRAAELATLFPDAFGEDGLPEDWTTQPLRAVFEINPKETMKRGTIAPYSDMASLPTSGPTTSPPIMREFGSGMRFRNGDALLARITPCLENGKSAYVDFLDEGVVGWGSTEFIVLRARPPVPKPMAYLLIRQEDFRNHAIRSMTGTSGRQRATETAIGDFRVAFAAASIYPKFGELTEPLFALIRSNAVENETLAEARDYLLPKLMSGEIRVTETSQK